VAASLGLRWFDDPESAQAAVREIIGKARREFTVIDPYFGPEQIRDFAMAVTAGDVAIRIVTSEECLGREAEGGQEPVSVALERALSEFSAHGWSRPEVLVMKGRRAPLHDRFLVADGRVWLSGNSFHAIGARASVLIELPNPQEVLGHLRPYMERAEAFSTWFTHRVAPGARNEQPDGNSPPAREDDL
jgi:hypothetical protein